MRRSGPRHIIGTTDRIDFPEFGLEDIRCKIDTGADSSALHCKDVKVVEKDGRMELQFRLLDPGHPQYRKRIFRTTDFSVKTIKNSFGLSEERYVIKTRIRLFGVDFSTDVSLADRQRMSYPVLLGKRLLKKGFLIDVNQRDLSFQAKFPK
ncbi:MAG: RimK/LysX family protein [Bacteroidota bacterium]|nr:RimK/LysX family protein [Bacteroidota bacterium]MDX5427396.1 RimK/LysX family protein [Bacteroidota bacterium]MDX5447956.1 RimK/LysX family protein [Bacteroidota bacterium]MDX5505341.1 RimK/LysX family protein [Bacteroidota bacterium]